jgi:hypothetical protein
MKPPRLRSEASERHLEHDTLEPGALLRKTCQPISVSDADGTANVANTRQPRHYRVDAGALVRTSHPAIPGTSFEATEMTAFGSWGAANRRRLDDAPVSGGACGARDMQNCACKRTGDEIVSEHTTALTELGLFQHSGKGAKVRWRHGSQAYVATLLTKLLTELQTSVHTQLRQVCVPCGCELLQDTRLSQRLPCTILSNVACRLLEDYCRFGGTYCLHLQECRVSLISKQQAIFLRNVGKLPYYTALYPRRQYS